MFIQQTLEIINAFLERYVPMTCEQGDYTQITTEDEKVRFTFNNDYYVYAWIDNEELHIESEYGDDILASPDYYNWSKEDVDYIKFGKKPICADRIVGNIKFSRNGADGFSYQRNYTDSITGEVKSIYNHVSGNDLIDYTFHELIPYNFDKAFSKEEKEAFIEEYNRAKAIARYQEE